MPGIIIRNGRIIDPSQSLDKVTSLLIEDGKIAAIGSEVNATVKEIDATGKIIAPGLVDAHVQLREPGFEEDETIESGTSAAINGGFTSIACLPNTSPTTDTQAQVPRQTTVMSLSLPVSVKTEKGKNWPRWAS